MNSFALPAAEVAESQTPAPAEPRLAPRHRAVWVGAIVTALLAAWAFDGGPLGLGFTLTSFAFIAALAMAGKREAWQSARGHRWLLASAAVLASFVTLRDSALLVGLDALAVALLLLLAVRGWNGALPLSDTSLGGLVTGSATTLGSSVKAGAQVMSDGLGRTRLSEAVPRVAGPLARMVLVGGPVIGIVTFLLASGDAAFEQALGALTNQLFELPVPTMLRVGGVGTWVFVVSLGLLTWALRRRGLARRTLEESPALRLGLPEALALLVGLSVVLVLFSAVSARCAFSPERCSLPSAMTYSQYARRGFWELLTVASIVLMMVLSVPHRAIAESTAAKRALQLASTGLVLATLPVLLSAVNRMMLYEDVYGFTRQRVLSQAVCVFVALLLVWRAVTLWTWPRRFAIGAVGAAVLVLTGFNAMNPDAFIAERNIARLAEREGLDTSYLESLSADAARVLRRIPAERVSSIDRAYFEQFHTPPGSLAGWNLARACDRIAPPALESALCP